LLQIETESSLHQAELTPLELSKRNDQAQPLVLLVSVSPGAHVKVDNKSPERIAGGGSMKRKFFNIEAEFNSVVGQKFFELGTIISLCRKMKTIHVPLHEDTQKGR
jgi:hypothetical protein